MTFLVDSDQMGSLAVLKAMRMSMVPAFTAAVRASSVFIVDPSQQRSVAGLPPLEVSMAALMLLTCVESKKKDGRYTPTLTQSRSLRNWNHFVIKVAVDQHAAFTYLKVAAFGFVTFASLKVRMG